MHRRRRDVAAIAGIANARASAAISEGDDVPWLLAGIAAKAVFRVDVAAGDAYRMAALRSNFHARYDSWRSAASVGSGAPFFQFKKSMMMRADVISIFSGQCGLASSA